MVDGVTLAAAIRTVHAIDKIMPDARPAPGAKLVAGVPKSIKWSAANGFANLMGLRLFTSQVDIVFQQTGKEVCSGVFKAVRDGSGNLKEAVEVATIAMSCHRFVDRQLACLAGLRAAYGATELPEPLNSSFRHFYRAMARVPKHDRKPSRKKLEPLLKELGKVDPALDTNINFQFSS